MRTELDVLRDITVRLDSAGIAFMLTGSMAMNYYAQPRMTRDIDIVVDLSLDDAQRIAALFTPDYYADADMVREAVFRTTQFNIIDNQSIVKVDFVIKKSSEYRLLEFRRRSRVQVDGFETWIVSKEDLILSKLQWARLGESSLQLRDVRNLLATGYDRSYLSEWAGKLGVEPLLQEALHA